MKDLKLGQSKVFGERSPLAIVIDAKKKKIYEKFVNPNDYKKIVEGYLEMIALSKHKDTLLVINEEGQREDFPYGFRFKIGGRSQEYIGNGIIVGVDEEGNAASTKVSANRLKSMIEFIDRDGKGNKK